MSVSLEERLLIDRYLEGSLSGLELQQFMERLDSDPAFREAVSLQNLLVEGIVICADKELHDNLLQTISYKKSRVPLGLKLILTFLVVTVSGIVLWNYIGQDTSDGKKHFLNFSWLDPSQPDKNKKSDTQEMNKSGKANESTGKNKAKNSTAGDSGKEMSDESSAEADSTQAPKEEDESAELVVKKDQLLISLSLFVQDESSKKEKSGRQKNKTKKDSSLSEKTIGLLNPAAGLEEAEKELAASPQLQVEFWVSPINYRGYKWHRNKLILFGIDEPDEVRMFRVEGKLYMHYLNDFYLLEPAEDFTSYQIVNDKEFSLQQSR